MFYITVKEPLDYATWLVASSVSEVTKSEGFFDQKSSNSSDVELLLKSKRAYDMKDLIEQVGVPGVKCQSTLVILHKDNISIVVPTTKSLS